ARARAEASRHPAVDVPTDRRAGGAPREPAGPGARDHRSAGAGRAGGQPEAPVRRSASGRAGPRARGGGALVPASPPRGDATRPLLEKATLELKRLRAQNKSLRDARAEPIAIVGMGCRFPAGVHDPEGLWRLLAAGGDAIREIPPERWSADATSPGLRGAR